MSTTTSAKPEMVALSGLTISPDHPTIKKWLGTGAQIIAAKWNKMGGNLTVISKRNGEYQVIRAFYLSMYLVPADAIPEPQVSVDLRTRDVEEVAYFLLTGERREETA